MTTTICTRLLPKLGKRLGASGFFNDPLWNKVWLLNKFTEDVGVNARELVDDSIYAHGVKWVVGSQGMAAGSKFQTNSFTTTGASTDGLWIDRSPTASWINGTWTIEGWFKFTSSGAHTSTLFSQWSFSGKSFLFDWTSTGTLLRFQYSNDGSTIQQTISGVWVPTNGVWYHIAVQKTGTTLDISVDGVNIATGTLTNTIDDMVNEPHQDGIWVGNQHAGSGSDFHGQVDSVRITLSDRYQAYPFTLGALARHGATVAGEFLATDKDSTLLPLGAEVDGLFKYVDALLTFEEDTTYGADGGVFNHAFQGTIQPGSTDSVSNRPQFQTDASTQNVVVKHGTQSGDFITDSVSSNLIVEDRFDISSQSFCLECWVQWPIRPDTQSPLLHVLTSQWLGVPGALSWRWYVNAGVGDGDDVGWNYSTNGSNEFGANILFNGGFAALVWYHIASTRDDIGTVRHFVNGSQLGSDITGHSATVAQPRDRFEVGGSETANQVRAYIDDLRFTLGDPRYIANFTPPGPLPRSRFANERPLVLL